ncbi:galactosyltransferase-related protein [Amycolatopsis tolypomycina]|uniref:galactosyltransferase-related protein n=1 Tax=Amycolatopsis tolypomycina TaxID=208445 RepID=UPI0033B231B9
MSVAVIIPWGRPDGPDGAFRAAVWKRLRAEWAEYGSGRPDVLVAEAPDPLFGKIAPPAYIDGYTAHRGPSIRPFAVARAINNAVVTAAQRGADRFVCFGADMAPDLAVVYWAAAELESRPWTLLFDRGTSMSEEDTMRWLRKTDLPSDWWPAVERFQTPCVGPIAFTREAFEFVGGFDARYEGWAFEDVDFWHRLCRDLGPQTRCSDRPLRQYWHPLGHHDLSFANPNVRLYHDTWVAPRPRSSPRIYFMRDDRITN